MSDNLVKRLRGPSGVKDWQTAIHIHAKDAREAADRDALRAENERLREYGQAVVDEYPVSAGTSPGLCEDESGYGSIYRLCTALNAKTPPGEAPDGVTPR